MMVLALVWTEYWWVVLGLAVVVFLLWARNANKERDRRFRAVLEANGFTPVAKPRRDMKGNPALGRGYRRSFDLGYEVVYDGTVTVRVFDFTYETGVPLISTVGTSQTVIAFRAPDRELPRFVLAPATSLGKLGAKLGRQNIVPYNALSFSERYLLRGHDPDRVLTVFRPEVVRLIEAQPKEAEWTIASGGGWLAFFRPAQLLDPAYLGAWINSAAQFANAFYGRECFRGEVKQTAPRAAT